MQKLYCVLLSSIAIASLASAQPKAPVEPKAPSIEQKGETDLQNSVKHDNESREYPALVVFANGSKIRGTIILKNDLLAASCFCGDKVCTLREAIGHIKSVEFTHWKRESSSRRFRHSATIITLRDGSNFNCARIEAFDRFTLRREGKTLWCYTMYYADEYGRQKVEKKKIVKRHNVKLMPGGSSENFINPHPHAVQKIEFLREEKKSIFDFVPFILKK